MVTHAQMLMNAEKELTCVIKTLNVQITSDLILVLAIMVTKVSSKLLLLLKEQIDLSDFFLKPTLRYLVNKFIKITLIISIHLFTKFEG